MDDSIIEFVERIEATSSTRIGAKFEKQFCNEHRPPLPLPLPLPIPKQNWRVLKVQNEASIWLPESTKIGKPLTLFNETYSIETDD
jgi:hypothetical protein